MDWKEFSARRRQQWTAEQHRIAEVAALAFQKEVDALDAAGARLDETPGQRVAIEEWHDRHGGLDG